MGDDRRRRTGPLAGQPRAVRFCPCQPSDPARPIPFFPTAHENRQKKHKHMAVAPRHHVTLLLSAVPRLPSSSTGCCRAPRRRSPSKFKKK